MKIIGQVEIVNRLFPSLNGVVKGRSQRSSIAICKHPGPDNELYIIHQSLVNKAGTKYEVRKNIENVFTRFVNDGKATIRFKSPPVDMYIKCDSLQLKSFLQVLKLALDPKVPVKTLQLCSIATTSHEALKVKKKMHVISWKDYPHTKGFPRTLEILKISEIGQTVFDTRILRLQNLKKLDLSNNLLTSLPEALGNLPCLGEIKLQHNRLGQKKLNDTAWNWISGKSLMSSLQYLDLSNNQICILPSQLSRLHSLVTLKLDHNNLQELPQGIGNLRHLNYFSASNNKLRYLPGCIRKLPLYQMDVSENNFQDFSPPPNRGLVHFDVPRLLEAAAKIVITKRVKYSAEIIPWTLVPYLDNALYCICGKPCFGTHARKYVSRPLNVISPEIVLGEADAIVWLDTFLCSPKCVRNFDKLHC